jgi:hypothetical protein
MAELIDRTSQQTLRQFRPVSNIFSHRSPHYPAHASLHRPSSGRRAFTRDEESSDPLTTTGLSASNNLPDGNTEPAKYQRSQKRTKQSFYCHSHSLSGWVPSDSTLPVIGTLPDHFAESAGLARNSQHSHHPASESHFRATWMLQDAAVVANCNTYNRNQPVRELRKGLFFRSGCHEAGIDSTSESSRTAFHTIYDLTGIQAAGDCRLHAIQISDNPRHAPSVQC